MRFILSSIVVFVALPLLQVWCQTVQDDWTAPAAPDGSTPLQSGTKFTLLWKPSLQNSFSTYCPLCDTEKLDLWITNFNGTKYTSKIGRGIDLTTTTSYDWNVNIASDAFSEKSFWVFRFTFFDSADPYSQQISSPGFKISGLIKASSTALIQSSTTFAAIPSSSIASTSTSIASSSIIPLGSDLPKPTEETFNQVSPKSNVWIAGVVVAPIVGIALGAALMWFCLRKRRNKKVHNEQELFRRNGGGHGQGPKEMDSQALSTEPQPWQPQKNHSHFIAEAPCDATPAQPAELWQGNYRS